MKKYLIVPALLCLGLAVTAKNKHKKDNAPTTPVMPAKPVDSSASKKGPKPYDKVITNSNLNPIAWSFEIKALSKDSSSVVIDVTDFFKGDNQPISLGEFSKKRFNLSGQISDRTYIQNINSYPINTEVRVVRTFN